MKYEIEKNIPFPGRVLLFPLEQMEVGDSFFVKDKKQNYISPYLSRFKLVGKKFTSRKVEGGTRVWRIK